MMGAENQPVPGLDARALENLFPTHGFDLWEEEGVYRSVYLSGPGVPDWCPSKEHWAISCCSVVGRRADPAFDAGKYQVVVSRPTEYIAARMERLLPSDWGQLREPANLRRWVLSNRPKIEERKKDLEETLQDAARKSWRLASLLDPVFKEDGPSELKDGDPRGWNAIHPSFSVGVPGGQMRIIGDIEEDEREKSEEESVRLEAFIGKMAERPMPGGKPRFGFVDWASPSSRLPVLQEMWDRTFPSITLYHGLEALLVAFDFEEWDYLATYDGAWLDLLVSLWVEDVQTEEKRPRGIFLIRDRAEGQHTMIPAVAAPMAWAFGGAADLYEGHTLEPGAAALVPVSYAARGVLMPENAKRPSQMSLALSLETKGAPFFQVSTKKNPSAVALKPEAAKLAMLLFPFGEGRQKVTLGELGKLLYPSLGRVRDRELVKVAQALEVLDSLFYYLPNQTKVRCFDVSLPWTPGHASAEMEVDLGLSASFLGAISPQSRGLDKLWGARFVFNLNGYLALPNKKAAPLRILPMASQMWNEAFSGNGKERRFDLKKVESLTLDQWALKSNSLARVGLEHLAGNKSKSGSARLSEARDEVIEARGILEAAGLVRVEKVGKDSFRLLPPESWTSARADLGRREGIIGRL